ncbi:MAG: DUF2207 domain-containing protein [Patescibacteria group bacterium]
MLKHMMSMWRTKLAIVSVLSFFLLIPLVHAADFDFESFDVYVGVQTDGSLFMQETIRVNFHEPRHGIYRTIPTSYREEDGSTRLITISEVEVIDDGGSRLPWVVTDTDGAITIRIGDTEETIVGSYAYVIGYKVTGALQAFESFDELYWNVTGTEWVAPPAFATARVHLPEASSVIREDLRIACYTGEQGSTTGNCERGLADNTVVIATQNNYLTVAIGWPKGIVDVPPPIIEQPPSPAHWPMVFLALPILTFVCMYRRWERKGRDPKGRGTIVPQYDPPAGMKAGEVGMLWNHEVEGLDVSAGIVELAVQGYLRIVEVVEPRFGPDHKTFRIEKVKETDDVLRGWESELMNALFKDGNSVTEAELKKRFVKDKKPVIETLERQLVADGYYEERPQVARGKWIMFAIILGFVTFYTSGPLVAMTHDFLATGCLILTCAILLIFGILMVRRTEKGVAAWEHAKGFKLFLSTAEKYRLEWQEKENVFEKYLPYAMVFGVTQKWAKAMDDIGIEVRQPNWYVGSFVAFNAMDFSSRMSNLSSHLATAASPKGSGSGGGGSSGGGFGGGGGGSW